MCTIIVECTREYAHSLYAGIEWTPNPNTANKYNNVTKLKIMKECQKLYRIANVASHTYNYVRPKVKVTWFDPLIVLFRSWYSGIWCSFSLSSFSFAEHVLGTSVLLATTALDSWLSVHPLAVLRTFDVTCVSCSVWRLYDRTPLQLLWPVLLIISCSSTPASKSRVAAVARSEWLVKCPVTTNWATQPFHCGL